jgi:hypothetical protein
MAWRTLGRRIRSPFIALFEIDFYLKFKAIIWP